MTTASLRTVVLANAGTPFLRATRRLTQQLDPRVREESFPPMAGNDGFAVSDFDGDGVMR